MSHFSTRRQAACAPRRLAHVHNATLHRQLRRFMAGDPTNTITSCGFPDGGWAMAAGRRVTCEHRPLSRWLGHPDAERRSSCHRHRVAARRATSTAWRRPSEHRRASARCRRRCAMILFVVHNTSLNVFSDNAPMTRLRRCVIADAFSG